MRLQMSQTVSDKPAKNARELNIHIVNGGSFDFLLMFFTNQVSLVRNFAGELDIANITFEGRLHAVGPLWCKIR